MRRPHSRLQAQIAAFMIKSCYGPISLSCAACTWYTFAGHTPSTLYPHTQCARRGAARKARSHFAFCSAYVVHNSRVTLQTMGTICYARTQQASRLVGDASTNSEGSLLRARGDVRALAQPGDDNTKPRAASQRLWPVPGVS